MEFIRVSVKSEDDAMRAMATFENNRVEVVSIVYKGDYLSKYPYTIFAKCSVDIEVDFDYLFKNTGIEYFSIYHYF